MVVALDNKLILQIDNDQTIIFKKNKFSHRAEISGIDVFAEVISHEDKKFREIMIQDGIEPEFIKKSLSLEANRNSVF